ncbi:MAG TPA: DUF2726 domain-containing protein [Phycisphaerae bacterium]|jgi:hypothetical protein|nr:DUF2726 domain-containing protein [Phycisphaerae bacterium]
MEYTRLFLVLGCVAVGIVVIGMGVLIAAVMTRGKRSGLGSLLGGALRQEAGCVYEAKKYLMSRGEAAFYRVLVLAVGGEFVVMAKVRLGDVICARGGEWAERRQAWNRIWQKHVDFVLLDARDLRIRAVVELDDRSHDRADRRERDARVDAALRQAVVPTVHVPAAAGYGVAELAERVRGVVG